MWVRAHSPSAFRPDFFVLPKEFSVLVEQLIGLVPAHPRFQFMQTIRVFLDVRHRNLVRPPEPFQFVAVDSPGSRPAFRRSKHNHRPTRAFRSARRACLLLNSPDLRDAVICGCRHGLVHARVFGPFNEARSPAITTQETLELLARNARENCRVVDFVPVQMKDRQHGTVADRIQELIDMPGGGQGPCFRLTVSDRSRHDQFRVVERRSTGMRKHVTELPTFMNRPGRFGRAVAPDPARERKLFEELAKPLRVFSLLRVNLRITSL